MKWFVYSLRSLKGGGLYIGMTSDLNRRLQEHNRGYNRSTKARLPFEVIYTKEFDSRLEARQHEKSLKSTRGREMLRTASKCAERATRE